MPEDDSRTTPGQAKVIAAAKLPGGGGAHHEFARLLKITDQPDGYNSVALTKEESMQLAKFTVRSSLSHA